MKSNVQGRSGRGRTRPVIAGLLAVLSAATAVGVAAAAQGDPNDFRAVGPVSTQNGFPIWYRDADGTEVELCLDQDPLCRYLPGDTPDPNNPISFPDNFAGEAFWWAGEASIDDGVSKRVALVMAVEAAFASGEVATPGDQVSFGRVRVRMDDLVPGATYHVTHPYGEGDFEADEDGRVFATEDIGALTTPADYSLALDSPVFNNFLQWDADAPAGYLGDPNQDHTVTGSPTGNNFFRVTGPAGSFGPTGACPGVTNGSCVETNLFSIMGKHAQTSGVQTMRAVRIDQGNDDTDYLEVFANSRPGQKIMLTGVGIGTTQMKGVTSGRGDLYYAKVLVPGAAPAKVTATNQTDGTKWDAPVTDLIDVTAARYDLQTGKLTVNARSSVATGVTLTAIPGGVLAPDGTLSVPVDSPPLNVVVKSSAGGSDTEPVRLVGNDFQAVVVAAAATANPTTAIPGQAVLLDSNGSSGDIATFQWTQISGTPVTLTGATTDAATFSAPAIGGALTFRLTVTGAGGLSTSQTDVTVNIASGQAPVAAAGPDRAAIVGTNVTLDGSASQFATGYTWTQTGGPAVSLNSAGAIASFLMPDTTTPLVFALKATAGTLSSTDTVTITKVNEVVSISRAELRTRNGQLRVEGATTLFSMPNVVSIYASDGVAGTHRATAIGTIAADSLTGDFSFRVDSGVTLPAGVTRLDIFTSRGGVLENVAVSIRN